MAQGHKSEFTLTGQVLNEGTFSDSGKTPVYSAQIGVAVDVGDHEVRVARWVKFFGDKAMEASDICRKGERVAVGGRIANEKMGSDGDEGGVTFRDAYFVDDDQGFVESAPDVDDYAASDDRSARGDRGGAGRENGGARGDRRGAGGDGNGNAGAQSRSRGSEGGNGARTGGKRQDQGGREARDGGGAGRGDRGGGQQKRSGASGSGGARRSERRVSDR